MQPRGQLWFELEKMCRDFKDFSGLERRAALQTLVAVLANMLAEPAGGVGEVGRAQNGIACLFVDAPRIILYTQAKPPHGSCRTRLFPHGEHGIADRARLRPRAGALCRVRRRCRRGAEAAGGAAAVAALLARRRRGRLRERRRGAGRRPGCHGQLSRQSPARPTSCGSDLKKALVAHTGTHRLSLHASYAETGGRRVERNALAPEHFSRWVGWAKERQLGLDFNPTYFAHPKAADGFTLAHADAGIRRFWIEHGMACRKIGASFGRELGTPCITNVWIPDGYKDTPADRTTPRERLQRSLDEVFSEQIDPRFNRDAVEPKLFGLGSEAYVVGSHEFYLGYAISRKKLLCLDAGHFHPTETIADKISAVLMWLDEILLHVSRGVRWDSDHVVTLTDDLRAIAEEVVRGNYVERVHIGLDFSMPASTEWRPGSSARGRRSRHCSLPCWSQSERCASRRRPATQAATRLMLASKKSRPMWTRST